VFQTDGQEDGFHWPRMGHVNPGTGVHFGPVKKAIKCLLVFFAQGPPEWLQSFTLGFQNVAKRHKCPTHFPLPDIYEAIIMSRPQNPPENPEYSSYDEFSRRT
jgi:hypothetical protein